MFPITYPVGWQRFFLVINLFVIAQQYYTLNYLLSLKRQSHQHPGLSRTVPDCPGPSRTEILPIRGQIRVGSVVIRDSPGWSGMVRDTTTEVLKCLKLPGSSVTVRDDSAVREGPCSDRVGSWNVRSGTVLIRGDPACFVGDFFKNYRTISCNLSTMKADI